MILPQTAFPARAGSARKWAAALAVGVGVILSGCRSAPVQSIDAGKTDAPRREGQAAWTPGRDAAAVVIDLQLWTRGDGKGVLDVSKAGLPFAGVQLTDRGWRIETVTGRKYSARGSPPARVGWLQLAAVLAGRQPAPPWQWQPPASGNWRLANPQSGESFEGFLTP